MTEKNVHNMKAKGHTSSPDCKSYLIGQVSQSWTVLGLLERRTNETHPSIWSLQRRAGVLLLMCQCFSFGIIQQHLLWILWLTQTARMAGWSRSSFTYSKFIPKNEFQRNGSIQLKLAVIMSFSWRCVHCCIQLDDPDIVFYLSPFLNFF